MHNHSLLSRVFRAAAFVFVPLLFSVIGVGALYFSAYDVIAMVKSVGSIVVSQNQPSFQTSLDSMFEEEAPDMEEIASSIEAEYGNGEDSNKDSNEKPDYFPMSEYRFPGMNSCIGKITCERLNLDVALYFGTSDEVLLNGVGIEFYCKPIGFDTRVLVAGHRQLDFVMLQYAEVGDIFEVMTYYGKYVFQATEIKIVDKSEIGQMNLRPGKEELVLFTCYPFENTLSQKSERYLVICEKISGLPIRAEE